MGGDFFRNLLVNCKLFLLIRWETSIKIQELRAVEADACGAAVRNVVYLLRKFDICGQSDMVSVESRGVAFSE